jgi:hypothetical protein
MHEVRALRVEHTAEPTIEMEVIVAVEERGQRDGARAPGEDGLVGLGAPALRHHEGGVHAAREHRHLVPMRRYARRL